MLQFRYPVTTSRTGKDSLNQNSKPGLQINEGKAQGQVDEQRSRMTFCKCLTYYNYVVAQFCSWFKFFFSLSLGMISTV